MPRAVRETLVSIRDLAFAWGPFLLIGVALLVAAYFLLDPTPPHRVVMATGPENSAYAEFGKRYAAELKRHHINVELRNTAGSRENLVLLRDGKQAVDLAFVQGGSSETIRANEAEEAEPVVSLGSLFYEPVWIFYRAASFNDFTSLGQLRGKRVNIGERGSGTPGLFMRLLRANQIERDELQRTLLGETEAVVNLLDGKLDAIVLVSAPEASMVQMLLQTPGIRLRLALDYYRFVYGSKDPDPALADVQSAYLQPTPVPTLYLHGVDDGVMGAEIVVEDELRPHFPAGLELVMVPGTGHFLHLEEPDVVNHRIVTFLAS